MWLTRLKQWFIMNIFGNMTSNFYLDCHCRSSCELLIKPYILQRWSWTLYSEACCLGCHRFQTILMLSIVITDQTSPSPCATIIHYINISNTSKAPLFDFHRKKVKLFPRRRKSESLLNALSVNKCAIKQVSLELTMEGRSGCHR